MGLIVAWFNTLKKWLSPLCAFCGLDRDVRDRWWCAACDDQLDWLHEPFCLTCQKPFFDGASAHRCSACLKDPPPYDIARSLVAYRGFIRKQVLAYKYSRTLAKEAALQDLLQVGARHGCPEILDRIDGIVPMPPDPKRARARGYNPAFRLAIGLATVLKKPLYSRELKRAIRGPQTGLSPARRTANVAGAFSFHRPRDAAVFRDKILLVVDDVWTTGSTAAAFAQFLKKEGGAARIYVLTLARTVSRVSSAS